MAKRNLTKNQIRTIHKNKTGINTEDLVLSDNECLQQALVLSHQGKQIKVAFEDNTTVLCQFRQNLGHIVAGDQVQLIYNTQTKTGIICEVLPRTNELKRPSKLSKSYKVMAANIDQMIIMLAVEPAPIEHYIDRYLVIAEQMNIKPILLINKSDLLEDAKNRVQIDAIYTLYTQLGYSVHFCSALKKDNLSQIRALLENKSSIFVGQSGVGKSEMLNALFDNKMTETGNISQQNKRGKHTTTTATLYHLDQKSSIIDSPGIREFGIWHLNADEIFAGFVEFRQYIGQCKFRNCQHLENTKGCALNQALDSNSITKARFNNYHRLIYEMNATS